MLRLPCIIVHFGPVSAQVTIYCIIVHFGPVSTQVTMYYLDFRPVSAQFTMYYCTLWAYWCPGYHVLLYTLGLLVPR
jgi:hypothetical protein